MASAEEAWEIVNRQVAASVEDTPELREAVARCQNAEDDVAVVHAGTQLWKVRSFSKWFRRKYYLDRDNNFLKYEQSHKHNCISEPRYIPVSEIVDVRRGWKTDTFNKFGNKVVGEQRKRKKSLINLKRRTGDWTDDGVAKPLVDEACCFSVVYGDNRSSLDLVADSPQVADLWVRALRHVVTVLRGHNQEKRFIMWLQAKFQDADIDKSGSLHFDEVLRLLLQLNVKMSKKEAIRLFNLADTHKPENPTIEKPSLNAQEFVQFYQLLMRRPELEDLYHKYARSAQEMTAAELQRFLQKEQDMPEATLEDCKSLIDAYEMSELKSSGRLSIPAFTHMLCSETFQVSKFEHIKTVYQDMTQPLSSYYIATSHNTYLLGRQVVADSTIEGYVEALWWGCRCLELDCWDGPDGEPVVTHGYALTSKLIFREVLKDAILPNAFAFSEYPLILSLENHCTPEQQQRLAFHITDVFGDLLYLEPVPADMETLPSPEQLKRRILIKGRKAAPVQAAESESEEEDDDMESLSPNVNGLKKAADSSDEGPASSRPSSRPSSPNLSAARNHAPVRKTSSSGSRRRSQQQPPPPPHLEKVTDQHLSDLVNVCQGVHFKGFKEEGKCYQMVSLSEGKATKLIDKSGEELIAFNTKRLCKVYPSGLRTDSTNFQPWPFWNAGCQIVALNYQGNGDPMSVNDARFRDNGGCGYVLKPDFLRLPDFAEFSFNPTAHNTNEMPRLKDRRRLLRIKIISGQHLPKPDGEGLSDILDPYVKVKIFGHPMDQKKKQTHVVHDNGLNPQWNTTFKFVVNFPELTFISFIVKDETPGRTDPIVGAYSLPLTSLALGYRHVPLSDWKRRPLEPSSLFIHTELSEVVAS